MITVCKTDDAYPRRLRELASMPEELYVIGELPDDSQPSVAIVGARMCSGYGRRTAYEFGRILAGKGVQVISGMASGIDSSAQEGALDGGGKSFAVLGGGADVCYPRGNTTLYNRLKEQGGIIPNSLPEPRLCPSIFRQGTASSAACRIWCLWSKQNQDPVPSSQSTLRSRRAERSMPSPEGSATRFRTAAIT